MPSPAPFARAGRPHATRRLLLAALGWALLMPLAARETQRPNILFAFADDWGRYASAYADLDARPTPNHIIQTPAFDRIAAEGALFTHAFVTAPSCTPCRSALCSGQYWWRTGMGAILQGALWDPEIPSFPLLLRDAGYHIGQTYKVWSPGRPRDAPFGERAHEYESAGTRFNQFSQNVTKMVAEGLKVEEAKQVLYDEVLANFDAFIADRQDGQPFCYWFGPTNVHRKWVKGSGNRLWGLAPDALEGRLPAFLPDVHDIRADMVDYLGEVMAFDTAVGLLIERLEEVGELDNTLVVISGDHGVPGFTRAKTNLYDFGTHVSLAIRWPGAGKRGHVVTDFVNLMDLAPTFCEFGGVEPPAVMTGRSLLPVLAAERGGRVDKTRDFVVTGRERHVGDARAGRLPYPQRALRTDTYLYIRNFMPDRWPQGDPFHLQGGKIPPWEQIETDTKVTFADVDAGPTKAWLVHNREPHSAYYDWAFGKRPAEELYDIQRDPDQLLNLANDPQYSETRKVLADRLMRVLKQTDDPRVQGDGSTFDRPPYAGEESPPR